MALDMDALTPLVRGAARKALQSFPDHHEREDAEQVCWLWIFEHRRAVEQAMTIEGWEKELWRNMFRQVNAHLRAEDAAHYGYDVNDHYIYTVDELRSLLPDVFHTDHWQISGETGECDADKRRATNLVDEGGDQVAKLMDVKNALSRLSDDHYRVLVLRYKYNLGGEAIAEHMGVSQASAMKMPQRALESLRGALGTNPLSSLRQRPTGGASNAEARARLERDFD